MNKSILTIIIIISINVNTFSQSVGVSYLFPKDGELSLPVSPFYYTMPLQFNDYFGINLTGAIYYIGGMSVKGLPDYIENHRPLLGPFVSLAGNVMPAITIPFKRFEICFQGGVFGFYNINPSLINGNIDRMLIENEDIDMANSDFSFDNNPGWGWVYGINVITAISKKRALIIGCNYFDGSSDLNLRGSYNSYKIQSATYKNVDVDYSDSKLNFNAIEVSIGIEF
ncbi:MAG: hypothetical protein A2X12_02375 [Bacteroidetes bacterium GWE2_29_8]|nr:MAG: hypothetical protein A2X12_02375 [Bacteroidetes bacterium GWE2_29_8]OFY14612.1 MAG: hypothetical protein A2X02_05960 [Bacteroidetes bacterium GWF2_29_10]